MSKNILVFSTAPDAETARMLAGAAVEEGLAACVNILPGLSSVYRWQGAIESATEVLLLIKTREELFEALRSRMIALHPYEVPELIAVPIEQGHPPYLEWIGSSTRPV